MIERRWISMYLTYDEYVNFGGGALDETVFQQLEFEVRTIIDWRTFNRLQNEEDYPESVKRCMFALIKLLQQKQQAMIVDASATTGSAQAGITGESNDGVSTTYNVMSAKEAVDTMKDEFENTIKMYLSNVKNSLGRKVLYRGLYPDE